MKSFPPLAGSIPSSAAYSVHVEVSEKIGQLKMAAPDGKQRFTDCANTETMFCIIQSIAEATTTKLHRDRDSQGMVPLKKDA
jgi:hypothetical protein